MLALVGPAWSLDRLLVSSWCSWWWWVRVRVGLLVLGVSWWGWWCLVGVWGGVWLLVENCTVDASIFSLCGR